MEIHICNRCRNEIKPYDPNEKAGTAYIWDGYGGTYRIDRLTQDNSPSNLVPLCIKHHPEYEKASLGFIELMKDDYETAKVMLNNMWRAKQRVTMQVIRRILSERKPTTN